MGQVLPTLSGEEYQALKADIAARGVQVAVEYDEAGDILDGHHRVRACTELGIKKWPRVTRLGLTLKQKTEHALKLNLLRRQIGIIAWVNAFKDLAEVRGIAGRINGTTGRAKENTATIAALAKEVGVSERTARHRLMVSKALKDHPELSHKVDSGELPAARAVHQANRLKQEQALLDNVAEVTTPFKGGVLPLEALWRSPRQILDSYDFTVQLGLNKFSQRPYRPEPEVLAVPGVAEVFNAMDEALRVAVGNLKTAAKAANRSLAQIAERAPQTLIPWGATSPAHRKQLLIINARQKVGEGYCRNLGCWQPMVTEEKGLCVFCEADQIKKEEENGGTPIKEQPEIVSPEPSRSEVSRWMNPKKQT